MYQKHIYTHIREIILINVLRGTISKRGDYTDHNMDINEAFESVLFIVQVNR